MVKVFGLGLLASLCAALAAASPAAAQEPPLERLLELNARDLFGGEASAKDGRVTVRFPGKGCFNAGFLSRSSGGRGFVADLAEIKDVVMKGNVGGGVENQFSFAAIDSGDALSKFEMADDLKVSFKVKCPQTIPQPGSISLRINQQDAKNYIQTNFFQDVVVVDGGKPKRKVTSDKRFADAPYKWFLQKQAPNLLTPVEVVFKDKKVSVFVTLQPDKDPTKAERVEVVSQDGIEKPSSGRIELKFSRMTFGVTDLVVEGKFDKAWAEREIARLRKENKLKLKEPEPVVAKKEEPKPAPQAKTRKAAGPEPKKPEKPKKGGVNVDNPDPEADDDL